MLMPAELKGCVTWFIYFLDLLWVRYNCAKCHHCSICVIDFREGGLFAPPPPIREQPRKSPSWIRLRFATQGFQALLQHSRKSYHELTSMTRFSEKQSHFFIKSSNSRDNGVIDVGIETGSGQREIKMSLASELHCSTEAMWLFKVAEEDYSFR